MNILVFLMKLLRNDAYAWENGKTGSTMEIEYVSRSTQQKMGLIFTTFTTLL